MSATPELTTFEKMKIQMEFAVPLLRDLQEVMGKEAVLDALQKRTEMHVQRAKSQAPGTMDKMIQELSVFSEGENVLEMEPKAATDEVFEFDVNRCSYKNMMEELGALDLGSLLICSLDYTIAAANGVQLDRSETIMTGAKRCDFRFCRKA